MLATTSETLVFSSLSSKIPESVLKSTHMTSSSSVFTTAVQSVSVTQSINSVTCVPYPIVSCVSLASVHDLSSQKRASLDSNPKPIATSSIGFVKRSSLDSTSRPLSSAQPVSVVSSSHIIMSDGATKSTAEFSAKLNVTSSASVEIPIVQAFNHLQTTVNSVSKMEDINISTSCLESKVNAKSGTRVGVTANNYSSSESPALKSNVDSLSVKSPNESSANKSTRRPVLQRAKTLDIQELTKLTDNKLISIMKSRKDALEPDNSGVAPVESSVASSTCARSVWLKLIWSYTKYYLGINIYTV